MVDDQEPPAREDPPEAERGEEKKRLFEGAIPELVKRIVERAVESGVERLAEGPENLKQLADRKLPKEVLHYLYGQVDDTKNGLYRAVAKEIRDVLEHTQFADEITKVLTKLSFEIRTEIRFVPNDAGRPPRESHRPPPSEEDGEAPADTDDGPAERTSRFPKPEVTAQVSVRDRSKEGRRYPRRREEP
jgi:hypothetical protein